MLGATLRSGFRPMLVAVLWAMLRPALAMGPLGRMFLAGLRVLLARAGLLGGGLMARLAMFAGFPVLARLLGLATWPAAAITAAASTATTTAATATTTAIAGF